MRLFHIHPTALPTGMLTHQHRTCHLLLSGLAEVNGVVGKYGRHAGFVAWVHWQCVQEMVMRGMNHDSPVWALWQRIPALRRGHDIWVPSRAYIRDAQDLRAKMDSNDKRGDPSGARVAIPQGIAAFQRDLDMLRAGKALPGHVLAV